MGDVNSAGLFDISIFLLGLGLGALIQDDYVKKQAINANVAYYDSKTKDFKFKQCEGVR